MFDRREPSPAGWQTRTRRPISFGLALASALLIAALALGMLQMSSTTTGFAAPSAADQVSGPYVGMWTSGSSSQTAQLQQLGVGWARAVALWSAIESADNTYSWGDLDGQVNAAAGNGRRVLVMVRNNPAWAATSRCRVSTDAERARLADFMTAAVNRYKDRVKYWQLYNEMDNTSEAFDQQYDLGGCFGTASGTTPTQAGRDTYARTLETVGAAIHTADPQAKVISGALVSGNYLSAECPTCLFDSSFGPGVLASLKANGTLDRVDYLAVHYFSSQAETFKTSGPDLLGRVNKLRQDMRDAGLSEEQLKPIVVDEGSYTGMIGTSTSNPNDPFNRAQRDYVAKALARAAAADVVAYYWFALKDTNGGLGGDNAYGLIAVDDTLKPSFRAMQQFQSLVTRQEQFVGRLTPADPKLEGYELTASDGRRFQIVWNEVDTQGITYSPAGNILAVTDVLGASVSFSNNAITVGSEPRYVVYNPMPPTPTPTPTRTPVSASLGAPAGVGAQSLSLLPSSPLFNSAATTFRICPGCPNQEDVETKGTGTQSTARASGAQVQANTITVELAEPLKFAHAADEAIVAVSTEPVVCTPRTEVKLQPVPDGPGRLKVTLTAQLPSADSANRIKEIRFGAATNALVDIGNTQGQRGGFTYTVPTNTQTVTFTVRRATAGQATTVPVVVIDGCGEWSTLVGGGAGAF
jgi:hypothetical protein